VRKAHISLYLYRFVLSVIKHVITTNVVIINVKQAVMFALRQSTAIETSKRRMLPWQ